MTFEASGFRFAVGCAQIQHSRCFKLVDLEYHIGF